jgi:hypothetical protein
LQNLNFPDYLSRIASIISMILFGSFTVLIPSSTAAQQANKEGLLPLSFGRWQASGSVRTLNPDQWSVLPNADIYAEYGLQHLSNRSYTDGQQKINLEVFEMKFASGAYGLYTYNQANLTADRQEFYSGRYLFSLSTTQKDLTDIARIDQGLIEDLKKLPVDTAGEHPYLQSHLPEENKIADSERYLLGPVALSQLKNFAHLKDLIDFQGGTEVVTAAYRNGNGRMNLVIIEFHTPQSAKAGLARLTAHLNSLPQEEKEQQILKRVGNYIVNAVGIQDISAAQKIINQIKYTKQIIWEGSKFTDIPLEARPPDPTAIAEAKRTIVILVRSLYYVVLLITGTFFMGVLAGTTYFYWRRYRRRKLGIDDIFGDLGDSIRLNLDDYLLDSEDSTIKRLGSGKG